uniref:Homeobox domain-containing protein n=1 Tax=Oryzias latipes TaxID=8090 RepID=A0A3P9K064_ORYLA
MSSSKSALRSYKWGAPQSSAADDEEINKMSIMSSLPHKVIKHWFRNTLFKERQRDKDSPYNFNNPPTTPLEDSREDIMQNQHLTLSPCSLSPGISANNSPQPQTTDLLKGEPQRGRRSSRTRFTEQQLETLQGVFEATPYPREEEYDRLSALLSLPNRVIVVWFQNSRRAPKRSLLNSRGEPKLCPLFHRFPLFRIIPEPFFPACPFMFKQAPPSIPSTCFNLTLS